MIAAPFLGEFGWEVALWVPWLRYCRQQYRAHDFHVMCKPGHSGLYKDFATTVTEWKPEGITKVDCQNAWIDGVRPSRMDYVAWAKRVDEKVRPKNVLTPWELRYVWNAGRPPLPMKDSLFHKLGNTPAIDHFIAIHARACDKQSERNWSFNNWCKLVEKLPGNVASIGIAGGAMHIPGTENMRGLPLDALTDLLASCKWIIGPSSGPLHLANHCGTPAIWWSGNAKDKERYETAWNPFEVPNVCAAESWDPEVEDIYEAIH